MSKIHICEHVSLKLLQPEPDPDRYDDPTAVVSSTLCMLAGIYTTNRKDSDRIIEQEVRGPNDEGAEKVGVKGGDIPDMGRGCRCPPPR